MDRREDRKIVVAVKDGRKYTCEHVILATPISVTRNISIEEVPLAKKLIYENQIEGSVTRYNMIFPTAFWRSKYTGYATFSHHFPFN